jgi:hypothetical protein
MGAPGRLFDMPVPWLCHRPALQASRQYLDGLGECICLYLEPVHALLHRGRAGRTACFRWCVHDWRCCSRAEGNGQGLRSHAVMPGGPPAFAGSAPYADQRRRARLGHVAYRLRTRRCPSWLVAGMLVIAGAVRDGGACLIVGSGACGPQRGPADPVVVAAQQQVHRVRAAGGRRHHHGDHRPGWAAAGPLVGRDRPAQLGQVVRQLGTHAACHDATSQKPALHVINGDMTVGAAIEA